MPTLQLRRTSLFWFQGAWELGRVFGCELFCFCLFVCFTTPKVGDYFVFKSHKWVRFVCFVLFCFVFFFFVLFCFVLFFLQSVRFSHHISWARLIFFSVSQVGKVFCFLSFLFVFILFCFVLFFVLFCVCGFFFASENSTPLDIKWCALILILLHRWWWTLRHRKFWTPVQFSEKSNSNLKLH